MAAGLRYSVSTISETLPSVTRVRGDDPGLADDPRARHRVPLDAMKRYHVTTFGCQMNEHDSERMKGMLESLGYARGGRAATRRT